MSTTSRRGGCESRQTARCRWRPMGNWSATHRWNFSCAAASCGCWWGTRSELSLTSDYADRRNRGWDSGGYLLDFDELGLFGLGFRLHIHFRMDRGHGFGLEHALRRGLQVPDEAEFFQAAQDVIGDVDLVPEKALAAGKRIVVVVVVPTLAHGEEREPEAILA